MQSGPREQREFDFFAARQGDGVSAWREARRAACAEAAKKLGFPLGHECEVWLKNGIRLRGELRADEEELYFSSSQADVKFVVGKTSFECGEIESCVRVD